MALGIHSYMPEFTAAHRIAEAAARQSLPKESLLNYLLFIWNNLDDCWHNGIDATRMQKGISEISEAMPTIYLQLMNGSYGNPSEIQLTYKQQIITLRQVGNNIEVISPGSTKPHLLTKRSFISLAANIRSDIEDEKNIDIYSVETREKLARLLPFQATHADIYSTDTGELIDPTSFDQNKLEISHDSLGFFADSDDENEHPH